eukprot:1170684-Rhodomonas_salina.1
MGTGEERAWVAVFSRVKGALKLTMPVFCGTQSECRASTRQERLIMEGVQLRNGLRLFDYNVGSNQFLCFSALLFAPCHAPLTLSAQLFLPVSIDHPPHRVRAGTTIHAVETIRGGMPASAPRIKMPANNRMHSSAALRTTDIWSNVIGNDFGKANDASAVSGAGAGENAYEMSQNLMALARLSGASKGGATRGSCKRCGEIGHLSFQCFNMLTGSSLPPSSPSLSSLPPLSPSPLSPPFFPLSFSLHSLAYPHEDAEVEEGLTGGGERREEAGGGRREQHVERGRGGRG